MADGLNNVAEENQRNTKNNEPLSASPVNRPCSDKGENDTRNWGASNGQAERVGVRESGKVLEPLPVSGGNIPADSP